jgi:hypothetical protein
VDPTLAAPGTSGGPAPFASRELLLPLGLALALGAGALRGGPRFFDDAYITFRYARNLAEGAGLVYNAGERVLGTSAPLFAVLLAALHRATGAAIPALAFALGAACLPLVALLGYRLARRVTGPAFATLFVAAALSPRESLRVFASGMETPLYLLGLLLVLELACRGRDVAAVAVTGGLAFVHPDAVLLVPALALALRASRGRWPWRAFALGLGPAAAATAALWVAYGSPVPHSVTAKRLVYAMAPGHAFSQLADVIVDPLVAREAPAPPLLAALVATGALALVLFFGRRAFLELSVLACAGFSALYLAAFAAANPLVFEWYRPPLSLTSAFVIVACAARVPRSGRGAMGVLLGGSFAFHLAAFRSYDPSDREEVYARAAAALALRPDETVAAPEIGALGWATRARVLDTTGLVSPSALAWSGPLGGGNGSVPPRLLRETDAVALVTIDRFLAPSLAADPGALDRWSEIAIPGVRTVRVFRRVR